jgi:hypothetical protein
MNGAELLHFSWSLCIGVEVAVQTAGPATRLVHRAADRPVKAFRPQHLTELTRLSLPDPLIDLST